MWSELGSLREMRTLQEGPPGCTSVCLAPSLVRRFILLSGLPVFTGSVTLYIYAVDVCSFSRFE